MSFRFVKLKIFTVVSSPILVRLFLECKDYGYNLFILFWLIFLYFWSLKRSIFVSSREYRREILFPVLQSIARQHGQPDLYEGLINDTDTLVIPKGASEIEIKLKQVKIE